MYNIVNIVIIVNIEIYLDSEARIRFVGCTDPPGTPGPWCVSRSVRRRNPSGMMTTMTIMIIIMITTGVAKVIIII